MNEINRVVDEIKQIHTQYIAEVGEGRKPWPKSIRQRIDQLEDLGVKPKLITELTGVPYETVCYWRYNRNPRPKNRFHTLTVKNHQKPTKSESKNLTVTVRPEKKPESSNLTVTVALPNGIRIEAVPFNELANFLASLGGRL